MVSRETSNRIPHAHDRSTVQTVKKGNVVMAKTAPCDMYDSVTWGDIPESAEVVAGYMDGEFAWPSEAWSRFPDAEKVIITVTGNLVANVCDVESGDLTPQQAAEWIKAKQAAGHRGATVYCSENNLSAVREACEGLAYYIWYANWSNAPTELPGTVAHQFRAAGIYDVSYVYSQEWLDVLDTANRPWPL